MSTYMNLDYVTQLFFCTHKIHSIFHHLHSTTKPVSVWPCVRKQLRIPHAHNPEKELVARIFAWLDYLTTKPCLPYATSTYV